MLLVSSPGQEHSLTCENVFCPFDWTVIPWRGGAVINRKKIVPLLFWSQLLRIHLQLFSLHYLPLRDVSLIPSRLWAPDPVNKTALELFTSSREVSSLASEKVRGSISCLWSPVCSSPPLSVRQLHFLLCWNKCPESQQGGFSYQCLFSALIFPICLQHQVGLTTQLRESLPFTSFSRPSLCISSDFLLLLCLHLACLLPDMGYAGGPWERTPKLLHHPFPFPLPSWILASHSGPYFWSIYSKSGSILGALCV